jgi:phage tail sheath protein FI
MAFQLSPGVNVTEIDLTTVVPAVATSDGAIGGLFHWGPIGERILVDSETALVKHFGKPTTFNAETFFTAASFLSYTNRLWVSRGANTTGATYTKTVTSYGSTGAANNMFKTPNDSGDLRGTIQEGHYVYFSEHTNIVNPAIKKQLVSNVQYHAGTTSYGVNCTTFQLPIATTNSTAVALYFAVPETTYTAVGVEEDAVVWPLEDNIVKNKEDYINNREGNFDEAALFVAKYPGELGNSLKVSVCDKADSFSSNIVFLDAITKSTFTNSTSKFAFSIGSNTASIIITPGSGETATNSIVAAELIKNKISIGDKIKVGNSSIGIQYLETTSISRVTDSYDSRIVLNFLDPYRLHTPYVSNLKIQRYWEYHNLVSIAPGKSNYQGVYGTAVNDELHIVVSDEDGKITGTAGTVLEVFKSLSRATDAKNTNGTVNYFKDVINNGSAYIWFANDRTTAPSATAATLEESTSTKPGIYSLMFGADGYDESNEESYSSIASSYDLFASSEDIDISLVLQGRPHGSVQLANYIVDNICEIRKDCVAFVSPDKENTLNSFGTEASNLVSWRNDFRSSSYAVIDTGYKYMFDKYNDVYRWIPLNGDVAGLCARTDQTNDAWWSPAGFNRGQIKNLVKLAWNPRQADRDLLYSHGINPVVAFPGQGTILYGDKTAQAKSSAFDRINVRRLFIVLEKAISVAAKYSLFEFNDAFTRSQFKNLVTPYLRTIQGRRGITDFLVVCDDRNNTPQVIDSNQFVGDIYIKPARSINFIQLNFIAVGTGVEFSEVVGKF